MKIKNDRSEKNLDSKYKASVLLLVLVISILAVSVAFAEELDWARQDGGLRKEGAAGIAIDKFGNSYVTGHFVGTATFGAGEENETTLTSTRSNVFIASYDNGGKLLWVRQDGGSSTNYGLGIAIDGAGNIYVTGEFFGTVTFGIGEQNETTLTSIELTDIFVASYDNEGKFLWARGAGGMDWVHSYGIAVDKDGNNIITGTFKTTLTFGAGKPNMTVLTSTGNDDVFIASYDKNGEFRWARHAGGEGRDNSGGITVDRIGNSYVIGSFYVEATFGMGEPNQRTLTSINTSDVFIASYDSDGNFLWVDQIKGTSLIEGNAIAEDGEGNIYVTGTFSQTAIFGDVGLPETVLTSSSYDDIFIAKYATNGDFLWARKDGGLGNEGGVGIAVDREGNSYVIGLFRGEAIFGTGDDNQKTLTSFSQAEDIFLAVYDQNGKFHGVQQGGGVSEDFVLGIAVDKFGMSYIAGRFEGKVTFGVGSANEITLTSYGECDIYVARYNWRVQQEKIQKVIDEISDLIEAGSLNEGQTNSLIKKLEAAVHSLDQENYEAAIGQLGAFINAVEAAIQSGKLTPAVGQPLIDAVQAIIDYLES